MQYQGDWNSDLESDLVHLKGQSMDKAEKALPSILVPLGDKEYEVTCNFGALCRFEKATGKNPLDERMWVNPWPSDVVHLIWASLVKQNPTITVDSVAEDLTPRSLAALGELFKAYFQAASIDESEAEEKNVETPLTGLPSGA